MELLTPKTGSESESESESGLGSETLQTMLNRSTQNRDGQRDRDRQRDRMGSAGRCAPWDRFQRVFLNSRWSGCYLASNPVHQRVVLEQPIHSQDHITRRIKVGDDEHNIGQVHGGEPNGEPDHFGDPDGGGPVYENDFSGGHQSFQKMEAGSKLGIDEAEFSAGV